MPQTPLEPLLARDLVQPCLLLTRSPAGRLPPAAGRRQVVELQSAQAGEKQRPPLRSGQSRPKPLRRLLRRGRLAQPFGVDRVGQRIPPVEPGHAPVNPNQGALERGGAGRRIAEEHRQRIGAGQPEALARVALVER